MVRIVACINLFNGAQFLSAILYNVHEYVDEIIVFDGAWRGLVASGYYETAHSTDDSREILAAFPSKCPCKWVNAPEGGWVSHAYKRAAQLEFVASGDWQYLINDDELPIGNVKAALDQIKKLEDVTVVWIKFIELMGQWTNFRTEYGNIVLKTNRVSSIPRFFKRRKQFYGYTHVDFLDENLKSPLRGLSDYMAWKKCTIDTMQIVHLNRLRPPEKRARKFDPRNIYDVNVRGSKRVLLAGSSNV